MDRSETQEMKNIVFSLRDLLVDPEYELTNGRQNKVHKTDAIIKFKGGSWGALLKISISIMCLRASGQNRNMQPKKSQMKNASPSHGNKNSLKFGFRPMVEAKGNTIHERRNKG